MTDQKIYCRMALLATGWKDHVVIAVGADGRIESLGEGAPSEAGIQLLGPAIPGMPNCHSHGFQRLMAGLTGASGIGDDVAAASGKRIIEVFTNGQKGLAGRKIFARRISENRVAIHPP